VALRAARGRTDLNLWLTLVSSGIVIILVGLVGRFRYVVRHDARDGHLLLRGL